jgi:hypothetical protein
MSGMAVDGAGIYAVMTLERLSARKEMLRAMLLSNDAEQ